MAKIQCLPEQRSLDIHPSDTILATLLQADIPHTHVCGGNAYCSTCRIMILEGAHHCSALTPAEKTLAKKLDFPVHIRLACQTRVTGDATIRRLVLSNDDLDIVDTQLAMGSMGSQRSVALLSMTIRGATDFDEINFPYDIIYVMGRYFHRMDQVISRYGGTVNNYMGLWFMAMFDIDDAREAAERAVWAGLEMLEAAKELNQDLAQLSYPRLKLTIGIHYGAVVLVPVTFFQPNGVTPIGKAIALVNRIEATNKTLGSTLLVSESVYEQVQAKATIQRQATIPSSSKPGGYPVFEVTALQGDAPQPQAGAEPRSPESRLNRFMAFIQKVAGSQD